MGIGIYQSLGIYFKIMIYNLFSFMVFISFHFHILFTGNK